VPAILDGKTSPTGDTVAWKNGDYNTEADNDPIKSVPCAQGPAAASAGVWVLYY
jgi:hypothetical protein